ncbi:RNA polymerase II degradation factor 1-like isoform X3 [Haliotis rubra]|uniref:RNA polymerase II degradation factor 1-like isoform X3 n=1 Tax=Haliotis rubra TaxID=36100 RepID=UPI001EE5DA1A|nr:RNA polymerase II degradation factor 1-like isoform X3 [Haliotis rubra]
MLRDGDIRKRIAVAAKQDKLYKRPPVHFGNLSITDANSQQGQQQQPQQEGQQLSQQGQQQQPQQSSRPNAKEATEQQVQLELMEDEATTEQSLNNRKQKFGESETISDEQFVI